jgi:pyrimidine deaminase RibD-like protein
MADLTFIEKARLEQILRMSGGYVLDFTNNTFAEFVAQSTGNDIFDSKYEQGSGSKANRLRAFWRQEPNHVVGKLISDLLDYWRFIKGETEDDNLYRDCKRIAERIGKMSPVQESHATRPLTASSSSGPHGDHGEDRSGATTLVAPPAAAFTTEDREFASLAIAEARKSISEDNERPHPKVGAVVVKDGQVLGRAHRGEVAGCHAEYIALECKLAEASLVDATVYTTLEPCTERNHPKVPCAHRLVERKVKRVVIGMLDPNPVIRGRGQLILREANIITDLFPHDLMSQVEELNRDFIRLHKTTIAREQPKPVAAPPPRVIPLPVQAPVDLSDQGHRKGRETDRRTLDDLLQVLPSGGTIDFLRTNNFAGFAFSREKLNDLNRFVDERSGPDHEFIDEEIESLREDLRKKCNCFLQYLALNTWRVGPSEGRLFSVPEEWEYEQPERFERAVEIIHSRAQDVCEAYDGLIRTARKKLLD